MTDGPSIAASTRITLALLAVGLGGACQILSCEPPRCALGDAVGACEPGEVCASDGFCRRATPSPCAPLIRSEVTRSVSMEIVDDGLGVDAMGDELFGRVGAAFVADVRGCTDVGGRPPCPDGVLDNPPVVQPLGALSAIGATAFTPLVSRNTVVLPHPPIDVSEGFAVEVLFRTPTSDATTVVASMIDAGTNDGWQLIIVDGVALFVVADVVVGLASRSDATWMHVLCTVDPPVAGSERDDDDVICTVDGRLGFLPAVPLGSQGSSLGTGQAQLLLGATEPDAPPLGDAAVAVVRIWSGDVFALGQLPGGTLARSDALAYEARRRLSRYVGLRISVPSDELRFLLTNLDIRLPRAQPVEHGGLRRHEIVGGGWPRVTHTAQGLAGLLLEPDRFDLLSGAWAACADGRVELLGRPDACPVTSTLRASVIDDPATGAPVVAGPLVFSVFTDAPAAALELTVDGESHCTDFANFEGCTREPWEDAVRLVYRFTKPGPAALPFELSLSSNTDAVIWSPQLERGTEPTTPMNMLTLRPLEAGGPNVLAPVALRLGDKVLLTGVGLAAGARTSMRAKVASDGTSISMSPLIVGDGGERIGRSVELHIAAAEAQEIETDVVVTEDEDGDEFFARSPSLFSGDPLRVGVDVGAALSPCDDCAVDPVQITLSAPAQWNLVAFFGINEGEPGIVVEADVATLGLEPLPIDLVIDVSGPLPGCVEGAAASVSFVACAAGACSESAEQVWQGEVSATELGPAIGEVGVSGAFELALADVVVDALLLEVRFRTGAGGSVFALVDVDGNAVIDVVDDDGDARIESASGTVALGGAWATDDEWTQLSCFVGARVRCALNAGAPAVLEDGRGENLAIAGRVIAGARVGAGAAAVAFARAWIVSSQLGPVEEGRIADARAAASFGFSAAPRRGPFTVLEQRASATTVERAGTSVTVGPHWPRVLDDGGPVYVAADEEGLRVTASEVASRFGLGFTIAASFSDIGDGRFLAIVDETGAAPLQAFNAFRNVGRLRFTMAGDAGPLVIDDSAAFEGHELLVGVRLFTVVVESDGVPAFMGLPTIMRGGQAVVVGDGAPVSLRHLRVVSE
jgi:hypothetical protein